jgi:DNA-binding PadR family transcriptional regulator
MQPSPKKSVPMRSPVNWTLLGLVIERPSYGWELWTRFGRQYGDILPTVSESHIYAGLNALRDKGLIEEVASSRERSGRQPKPQCRATQEGLEAYQAWMIAQMREHHRRSREFARQLGAFADQPGTALSILERYEQACLAEKGGAIPTPSAFPDVPPPVLGDRLASFYGRSIVAATLSWVEYARRSFDAIDQQILDK